MLARVALLSVALLSACGAPQGGAPPGPRYKRLAHMAGRGPGAFEEQLDIGGFQKGGLHTHSLASDGDSNPEDVYAWYRDHGYNFLGLSDHNVLIEPARYRQLERPGFAIIAAEEITINVGRVPVHVNALCHRSTIGGGQFHQRGSLKFGSIPEALQWSIQQTLAQGGIALVNHPNHKWAFGAEALGYAKGARLLEMWSGNPTVKTDGDDAHPSEEEIWEEALNQGWDFAGVAVDDMHRLGAENNPRTSGPDRGWVYVFAQNPSAPEICEALRHGHLIASNGVGVTRFTVLGDSISLTTRASGGLVEFLGAGGAVLAQQPMVSGQPATYRLRGGEDYVRVRATGPDGRHAWTQAYRVAYR